jgi:formate hydrogenlyase transcriptional activator
MDLFYRLHVFPLTVPPLRERTDDIPSLVHHFTSKYADKFNKRIDSIPPRTMETLGKYPWPGNIRELQNFIERAVVLSKGRELEPPLNDLVRLNHDVPAEPATLKDAERLHILRTLEKTNGQLAGAAVLLGIPRSTLFYRIRRLGITVPRSHKPRKMTAVVP